MEIDLTCAGCPRPGTLRAPGWAAASGQSACLSWLPRDASPSTGMRLLDRPPVIGATYSLLVRHPFRGRIGSTQWVLFEPAAPWRDGWAGHGDRLAELAVARIEPMGFMGATRAHGSAEQQSGWLMAKVVELMLAPDLPNAFPQTTSGGLGPALSMPWPAAETTAAELGHLVYFERALTVEIGMWALLRRSSLGPPTLLASGEWGFHEARFHAGNRRLSAAEASVFAELG